jgi:hypothetical protein
MRKVMKIYVKPIGATPMFYMWKESNYCELVDCEDKLAWVNAIGDVLLYDRDVLDALPEKWNMALFANTQHDGPKSYPWVYFPRKPLLVEELLSEKNPSYTERSNESIFLGRIECREQNRKRSKQDWSKSVTVFSMPRVTSCNVPYQYSFKDYLLKVRNSKFGLCLPGTGPTCSREIELMALGTVPIFTPGVRTVYYDPIEKDKHYLFANNPNEVRMCIESCSKEKWEYMSHNCMKWYNDNCSRKGSFDTTVRIIRENS